GLAVDLDHHADLAVVDVAAHEAFGGNTTGLARLAADPLLAQPLLRLGEVAVGLAERLLAVHQPCSGLLAELLHHLRGHLSHRLSPCAVPSCGAHTPG